MEDAAPKCDALTQGVRFLRLISDWLGEGAQPVRRELAEQRAQRCRNCPMNVGGFWWRFFKNRIARTIRAQLALKKRMEIRVFRENELHMCRVCGCAIPLKVHVPLKHVKAHTDAGQMEAFRKYGCWIPEESDQS